MFPRKKRLPRSVFSGAAAGKRASSEHFSVVHSGGAERYAVVVSKKTARLSVTRHLIKRRVLAALHELSFPYTLIVYPKSSVSDMPVRDIKAELAGLLSKIRR